MKCAVKFEQVVEILVQQSAPHDVSIFERECGLRVQMQFKF